MRLLSRRPPLGIEPLEDRFALSTSAVFSGTVAEDVAIEPGEQATVVGATEFLGAVSNDGSIAIGADAVATFAGQLTGNGVVDGPGDAVIAGTIAPDGGCGCGVGTLAPSGSTSCIPFAGNLTFLPTSTYTVDIGGTTPCSEYSQLQVSGSVTLSGTLDVNLLDGFAPQVGDRFEIITFSSVIGDFINFVGLDVGGGVTLQAEFDGDSYDLVAVGVADGPRVTRVFVGSTAWSLGFGEYIETHGLGEADYGFAISNASGQLASIPWTNLNEVSIRFDQDVNVASSNLTIHGVNLATYSLNAGGFAYNSSNHTATWILNAGAFGADKIRLVLADAVTSASTGLELDGEWEDGVSLYPSGDGTAGTSFRFRINALPGDYDRNGVVNAADWNVVRGKLFTSTSSGAYSVFADLEGNGLVNAVDWNLTRGKLFTSLPAGEPGGASAPAVVSDMSELLATTPTRLRRWNRRANAIDSAFATLDGSL